MNEEPQWKQAMIKYFVEQKGFYPGFSTDLIAVIEEVIIPQAHQQGVLEGLERADFALKTHVLFGAGLDDKEIENQEKGIAMCRAIVLRALTTAREKAVT